MQRGKLTQQKHRNVEVQQHFSVTVIAYSCRQIFKNCEVHFDCYKYPTESHFQCIPPHSRLLSAIDIRILGIRIAIRTITASVC